MTMTVALLTPAEAAEMLAVSRATVYRLIREGSIESVLVRGALRVPVSAVQAYVATIRGDADLGHPERGR